MRHSGLPLGAFLQILPHTPVLECLCAFIRQLYSLALRHMLACVAPYDMWCTGPCFCFTTIIRLGAELELHC